MTDLPRALAHQTDRILDRRTSAAVIALPPRPGTVFCESDLKAMRTAFDQLCACFEIVSGSDEYRSAAIAVVHSAAAGPIDARWIARLAAITLGLNPEKAD